MRLRSGNGNGLGKHLILEFYECDPEILRKASTVEKVLIRAAEKADLSVLRAHSHQFEPQGATSMVVVGESHLAIHTWPEFGFAAADIFLCQRDPVEAAEVLMKELQPKKVDILEITRGSDILETD